MSTRLERQNREQQKRNFIKFSVLIIITIMAVILIYKVGQNVSVLHHKKQLQTVVAHYGSLEDKLQGEGLVLRSETVVTAPDSGHFENVVNEREKVSRNALVGYYISSGRQTAMYAPAAGMFTRQLDGLEGALQKVKIKEVGPEVFKYRSISGNTADIRSGQGVFKIVNNLEPTQILAHFPLMGTNNKIFTSQIIKMSINGKPMENYKVVAYRKDFKELFVILASEEFQEDLLEHRQVKVQLLLKSNTACLIPAKSIVKNGEKRGIYYTKGEEILFKPVKVLDIKGNTAVVEGLEATDMVITNPELVKQ